MIYPCTWKNWQMYRTIKFVYTRIFIRKKKKKKKINKWQKTFDGYDWRIFINHHTFSNYQSCLYIQPTRPNIVDDPKFREFHKIRFEIINPPPLERGFANFSVIIYYPENFPHFHAINSHETSPLFQATPKLSQHHHVPPRRLHYRNDTSVPLIAVVSSFPLNCPETSWSPTRNCCVPPEWRTWRDSFSGRCFMGRGRVPYGIINLRNLEEGSSPLEGIPRRRDVIDNGKGEVISVWNVIRLVKPRKVIEKRGGPSVGWQWWAEGKCYPCRYSTEIVFVQLNGISRKEI